VVSSALFAAISSYLHPEQLGDYRIIGLLRNAAIAAAVFWNFAAA
jgi:hypothetical protein